MGFGYGIYLARYYGECFLGGVLKDEFLVLRILGVFSNWVLGVGLFLGKEVPFYFLWGFPGCSFR